MTWETKDVLVLVLPITAAAVAWGIQQSRVTALAKTLDDFKRDTLASLKDQGRRLGELETANKIAREIARYVGKGTPVLGSLLPERERRRDDSGQVAGVVDDDERSERR